MKIMTIAGTRPELIRLSEILRELDSLDKQDLIQHCFVYTGQNYSHGLRDVFFDEMDLPEPNRDLGANGSFGEQLGIMSFELERAIDEFKPDRFLVLGDTNSSLGAIVAKRMGVPVYHMEAGNRSFWQGGPEEVNRKIIDHCTDVHMPYSERSRQHLLNEGIRPERIFVIGNPLWEVLQNERNNSKIAAIGRDKGLAHKHYGLVTLHRAENVDDIGRRCDLLSALSYLSTMLNMPLIFPIHPHTMQRMLPDHYTKVICQSSFVIHGLGQHVSTIESKVIDYDEGNVYFVPPMGFYEFSAFAQDAALLITDSGTVQEEAYYYGKPCLVMRKASERLETTEAGYGTICGNQRIDPTLLQAQAEIAMRQCRKQGTWQPISSYHNQDVSGRVVNLLLSQIVD